jgi:hypothetical protein
MEKLYAIVDMGKLNAGHRPNGWAMVSVPESVRERFALHREHCRLLNPIKKQQLYTRDRKGAAKLICM